MGIYLSFIYLDETFLNANHTVNKCWLIVGERVIQVPTRKGSRIIILHAGSKDGFVNNGLLTFQSKTKSADYHEEMNAETFTKWFTEQLLPHIPPNSLIVTDNAPYHSMQSNKIPTMSSRKADMQQWLSGNTIHFDRSWVRAQLYNL